MYDAVGARLDGEPEVNEEEASDPPFENKFSPSPVPRYIVHVEATNFNPRVLVKGLECCAFGGMHLLRSTLFRQHKV